MAGPESKIETAVCKYAEKAGLLQRKFKSPGRRNVPDRIFFQYPAKCFFIEFKAPGEVARPGQVREANKLAEKGFDVYFVDNVAEGRRIIDAYT